jgi:hypothetical protein
MVVMPQSGVIFCMLRLFLGGVNELLPPASVAFIYLGRRMEN